MTASPPERPGRGYVPIGDYAAIGDGRTVALVARDGSVDWLCLPDLDSPSVFAAVLDADRGGRFAPARQDVEARLKGTIDYWRDWAAHRAFDGPWREAVIRSALALELLFHAPSGAIAAAASASLPEEIGGERNWDYRFCWVRDSAFTLDALLQLGCPAEGEAFFWWLLHASQLSHPRLQVLYRLDGSDHAAERTLDLDGYRGSRPVRVGNAAAAQSQLDIYGSLLQTALVYAQAGGRLDRDTGRRLAGIGDLVCSIWREPDSGIWEVRSEPAATALMQELIAVAGDVGLYAEEIDRQTNELLGNTPQGLVHLALINAAVSISNATAA